MIDKDLCNGKCKKCEETFGDCNCDKLNAIGYGVTVPISDNNLIPTEENTVIIENCHFENARHNTDVIIHSFDRHSTLEERRIADINRAYPKQSEPMNYKGPLYGKVDKSYFLLQEHSDDIDNIRSQLDQLRKENEGLKEKEIISDRQLVKLHHENTVLNTTPRRWRRRLNML